MKIALSTIGKFHTFDLARELHARSALHSIYSGYPRFKLRAEGIPVELLHTFPWVNAGYMAYPWKHRMSSAAVQAWENINTLLFSRWLEHYVGDCDVFVGLSGSGLRAGRKTQARGGKYVCDRGSAHIRAQDALLREEHALWGLPYAEMDPRNVAREEAEYAAADCITVPSHFALQSFLQQGVHSSKLRLLPYGVNLSRFDTPSTARNGRFNVLFVGGMGLRKGIGYLTQAYQKLQHPGKTLTFAGAPSQALMGALKARKMWPADARVVGHLAQGELKRAMARSHVLVLPSIEDGFGLVMAQAMACGCPVVATENTGAKDLFVDGQQGFVVPIRDVDALAERLQYLADHPAERADMGRKAQLHVGSLGGWRNYGEQAMSIYRALDRHA